MPIYAYRCTNCGHEKDVLQKLSDAPLTQCPACGTDAFSKQVTAAGFQLKGSGWYVTDFRSGNGGNGSNTSAPKSDDASASPAGTASSGASDNASPASAPSSDAGNKPAAGAAASGSSAASSAA